MVGADREGMSRREVRKQASADADRSGKSHGARQRILALQRTAGNRATSQMIRRESNMSLEGFGTTWLHDDSDVTFTPKGRFVADDPMSVVGMVTGTQSDTYQNIELQPSGDYDQGTIKIKAGRKGVITIAVHAHFFMNDHHNWRWDQDFSCSWNVEADLTGKLKIGAEHPSISPATDLHARLQLIPSLAPVAKPETGEFQITGAFIGPSDSTSSSNDFNISGGKKDSLVSGGYTHSSGSGRQFPAGAIMRTFALKVEVTDPPPPPKKTPKVAFGEITGIIERQHDVEFERPTQTELSVAEERKLRDFFMSLSFETRQKLHEGSVPMKVTGYASTTGNAQKNRKYGHARVESVKEVLSDFGVTKFDAIAQGEYPYIEEDRKKEVEDIADRRVGLEIKEEIKLADPEPDFDAPPSAP